MGLLSQLLGDRGLHALISFAAGEQLPEGAQPSHDIHEPKGVQMLSCTATGNQVRWTGHLARVACPAHCEREPSAVAVGSGIHPVSSPVCMGAIVDYVLPVYGGEMMLSKVTPLKPYRGEGRPVGLESYSGAESDTAVSISATGLKGEAWHAYTTDSIDMSPSLPKEHEVRNCDETFDSLPFERVGTSMVINCPGKCSGVGRLEGSYVYSPHSAMCRAAEHAHVVGHRGGRALVTLRHGQNEFFGSLEGDDESSDAPGDKRSYTVALPSSDMLSRLAIPKPSIEEFLVNAS